MNQSKAASLLWKKDEEDIIWPNADTIGAIYYVTIATVIFYVWT